MVKTPWHIWAVGIFALLFNAGGAFDNFMTLTRNDAYMSNFSEEQLTYFYGFPIWALVTWTIAVWTGVLGAILLLMRRKAASLSFALSLATMIATSIWQFGLSETSAVDLMGPEAMVFSIVIFVVAALLFVYARHWVRRGVLR